MIFALALACTNSEPKEEAVQALPVEEDMEEMEMEAPVDEASGTEAVPKSTSAPKASRGLNDDGRAAPSASAPPDGDGTDAPPQLLGDSNVFSGAEPDDPPTEEGSGFPGQIQTNTLLSEGILSPVPEKITLGETINVRFNTLYPNGCWKQTEAEHSVNNFIITHAYNTEKLENQICTMAMIPGGFNTTVTPEAVGDYTGQIMIDGELRTQYTVSVTSPE
jgi:hypothetical protein